MKPIFFYSIILLVVNVGVYYGLIKPWKERLEAEENLPVGEITIDSLINTEEYLLPYYFKLTDGEVKPQMAVTKKRIHRYKRPSTHMYEYYTYYYGLVPIVQKGHSPQDQPVLVWMMYYDYINIEDKNPFDLPIDFDQWRDAGELLILKDYKHFNNKPIWEQMLQEAYEKYGMIPIAPEQLYFVSPVIKEKVDWKNYNRMVLLLIILDVILFLPILLLPFRKTQA